MDGQPYRQKLYWPIQHLSHHCPVPTFPTYYIEFKTGKGVPGYTPPSQADAQAALGKYFQLVLQYPFLGYEGIHLPTPVPEELLIPFGDFVTKYGLQVEIPTIWTFAHAIGVILNAPSIYVIQKFGIQHLTALFNNCWVVPSNFFNFEVYLKAGGLLGSHVLFNTTLFNVNHQDNGHQEIIVQAPSGPKLIRTKKILVTIPPTLDNMEAFSLTNTEKQLFYQWQHATYYTGIIREGIPEGINVVNVQNGTALNIPLVPFVENFDYSGIPGLHTFHTVSLEPQTEYEVKQLIISDVSALSAAGSSASIVALNNHTPTVPRVSVEAIKNGFYKSLNGLQGLQSTFYTGTAWGSDYTAKLWVFTDALLPGIAAAAA